MALGGGRGGSIQKGWLVVLACVAEVACGSPPPPQSAHAELPVLSYHALRDGSLTVTVVDQRQIQADSTSLVASTQRALEDAFTKAGIAVVESGGRALLVTIVRHGPEQNVGDGQHAGCVELSATIAGISAPVTATKCTPGPADTSDTAAVTAAVDLAYDDAMVVLLRGIDQIGVAPAATGEAAAPGQRLPATWNEVALDTNRWGTGDFTCVPAAVSRDPSTALSLRLSNGTVADPGLFAQYAPDLCCLGKTCPVAEGCPALGMRNESQVLALAQQLRKREIEPLAILLVGGQEVATVNLTHHGSIRRAMVELDTSGGPGAGSSPPGSTP